MIKKIKASLVTTLGLILLGASIALSLPLIYSKIGAIVIVIGSLMYLFKIGSN